MRALLTAVALGFVGSVLLALTRSPDLPQAVRLTGAVGPAALAVLFLVRLPAGSVLYPVPYAAILAVGGTPVAVLGHLLAPDPDAVVVLPVGWALLAAVCFPVATLVRLVTGRTREEVSP